LIFGFVLVYVGGYTLFGTLGKEHLVRSIVVAGILVVLAAGGYLVVRMADARVTPAASAPQ
jgi:hypothetical protein